MEQQGLISPSYIILCSILSLLLFTFTPILFLSYKNLYCQKLSLSASSSETISSPSSADSTAPQNYSNGTSNLNPWFKCTSMTAIICYYLSLFCNVCMILFVLIYNGDNWITNIMSILMPFFYFIADWIRLLIFTLQIDYSFRDSFLSYSNATIGCLYGSIIFMLILVLIIIILLFVQFYGLMQYLAVLYAILDAVLSIIFIILFLRRLFQLILARIEFKANEMAIRKAAVGTYYPVFI